MIKCQQKVSGCTEEAGYWFQFTTWDDKTPMCNHHAEVSKRIGNRLGLKPIIEEINDRPSDSEHSNGVTPD